MIAAGVLLALLALVGWGVGDFLIQRTTRLVGSAKALFFIGLVGFLALSPFVLPDLGQISLSDIALLSVLSIIVMAGAAFDFEALRQGKIAIVEPVVGLELPMAVGISVLFIGETLGTIQFLFMLLVFAGTVLVVMRSFHHVSLRLLEKGVWLAFAAAIGTALTSVLIGVSSQAISPLVAVWFSHGALALVSFLVILRDGTLHTTWKQIKKHPFTIAAHSISDNVAWVAFATAVTFVPISVANTISGGYIALAVLLGLFLNKEKVKPHQLLGIFLVAIGVIALSYFYG
ncbi:MAG: DMT family transporter [Candidatus Pacebacteria bacterium]|nr:DMT family transporter [Candidatus Paceibacterota bacterium]